jgi:hypothetical protein
MTMTHALHLCACVVKIEAVHRPVDALSEARMSSVILGQLRVLVTAAVSVDVTAAVRMLHSD